MTSEPTLESLLAERIVVLDGAMGTELQRAGLTEAEVRGSRFAHHTHPLGRNVDVLTLTQPDLVSSVHGNYLAAGCDVIQTNTFNSSTVVQADCGLAPLTYEMNVAAARLAKAACADWTARTPDRPRFVAGTIGPTHRSLSLPDARARSVLRPIAFRELEASYGAQVLGLIDGGCDLLLIETIFDVQNAGAALAAIADARTRRGGAPPVLLSATISESSGRMISGETVETFWQEVARAKPFSVGLNCSAGAQGLRVHLEALARVADCFVSCHPSAGLPDAQGQYRESPDRLAAALRGFASLGLVNIVGGCCGTTPAHTRAMVEAVRGVPPRRTRWGI